MFQSNTRIFGLSVAAAVWFALPVKAGDYTITGSVVDSQRSSLITYSTYSHDLGVSVSDKASYDSFGPGQNSYHDLAVSSAGPDGLHASASGVYERIIPDVQQYRDTWEVYSQAVMTYTDVIINGPGSGTVPVSFNLHLEGSLDYKVQRDAGDAVSAANASVNVNIHALGNDVGDGGYSTSSSEGDSKGGILANFNGNNIVTSNTFNAPLNTPFSVSISLYTGVNDAGWVQYGYYLSANSLFNDTLTFATDRPVFNLPDGYTVNAADAGIVGNSYSVPEPEIFGLVPVLVVLRRRRA